MGLRGVPNTQNNESVSGKEDIQRSESHLALEQRLSSLLEQHKNKIVVSNGILAQTGKKENVYFYLNEKSFMDFQTYNMIKDSVMDSEGNYDFNRMMNYSLFEFIPSGHVRAYECTPIPDIDKDDFNSTLMLFYDMSLYMFRKKKDNSQEREQVKIAEFSHEEFHKLDNRVRVTIEHSKLLFEDNDLRRPYRSVVSHGGTEYAVELRECDNFKHCVTCYNGSLLDKVRIFPNYTDLDLDFRISKTIFKFLSISPETVYELQRDFPRQDKDMDECFNKERLRYDTQRNLIEKVA